MTKTLTTERLREIAERRSPSLRWGEAEQIADECLANREAQPVAWRYTSLNGGIAFSAIKPILAPCSDAPQPLFTNQLAPATFPTATDKSQGWKIDPEYLQSIADAVGCSDDEGTPSMEMVEAVLLAIAPPAPAVPKEMTKEDAMAFVRERPPFKGSVECVQATWNACRAAMLAQPVSQRYKLVPVEPTEEMIAAAMGISETAIAIYKRMLAAAPEGGNEK